jgi:hypothetical protein
VPFWTERFDDRAFEAVKTARQGGDGFAKLLLKRLPNTSEDPGAGQWGHQLAAASMGRSPGYSGSDRIVLDVRPEAVTRPQAIAGSLLPG